MGSIPVIGMLWHKPYWNDLARTFRAETAQAQLQYITQGSRSVREYSAEFELHMGRLESFDERSLIRQFIWGLEESLAKAVTLQYPKTIHAAIGHAEAIELAGLASRRPRGTSVPRGGAQSGRGGVMQRGAGGMQRGGFWRRGQRGGFWGGQTTRGGGRVGPRGTGMIRGRGFPQGRSRAGSATGGRGGRTIGAPACWTCGSTAHFSANCPRNQQTRGGGRGPRNSGFRGGRSSGSGRSGVRFAGLSTVWDESGQTFYVTDEGQLLSDIPKDQQDEQTVQETSENV